MVFDPPVLSGGPFVLQFGYLCAHLGLHLGNPGVIWAIRVPQDQRNMISEKVD